MQQRPLQTWQKASPRPGQGRHPVRSSATAAGRDQHGMAAASSRPVEDAGGDLRAEHQAVPGCRSGVHLAPPPCG